MDDTEALVLEHLQVRGFSDIVYEPDGNVPPDFLVDGRIAVEVRRLNENEPNRETPKGLHETGIPFVWRLRRFLESHQIDDSPHWWLSVGFKRPIVQWKDLMPALEVFLKDVAASPSNEKVQRWIHPSVHIRAFPRTGRGSEMFAIGCVNDKDSGGSVISEFEYNLQLCLREKTAKVAPYRSRYPEWWLALVDHVAYGLDALDQKQFAEAFTILHQWDRVVVISAGDSNSHFEL